MSPRIVPRNEWQTQYNPTWTKWRQAGRRQPFTVAPTLRKGLVVHCNGPDMEYTTEAGEVAAALAVAAWHWRTLGWSDGAYSYLVGNVTGNAYELRGLWWDQFANGDDLVGTDNGDDTDWYTACWLGGNYQDVSDAAFEGMELVLGTVRAKGAGMRVLPHNDFQVKPCPGPAFTRWARDHDNRDLMEDDEMPPMSEWPRTYNRTPHGESNGVVEFIHWALAALGLYQGDPSDPKSPRSDRAVVAFETSIGHPSPNDKIGEPTLNALLARLAQSPGGDVKALTDQLRTQAAAIAATADLIDIELS